LLISYVLLSQSLGSLNHKVAIKRILGGRIQISL